MNKPLNRIRNPDGLLRLGKVMRRLREQSAIPQGKVSGMRQATISKIENGGDVTLDTFISYASALGFELSLVPVGRASWRANRMDTTTSIAPTTKPLDLLAEFTDLEDPE